jgi:hypothetical protein
MAAHIGTRIVSIVVIIVLSLATSVVVVIPLGTLGNESRSRCGRLMNKYKSGKITKKIETKNKMENKPHLGS